MPHLVGIFVSGTYLVKTCEVRIAVGCILAYTCKTVGSICPCCMNYISNVVGIFFQ